jgi:hypothetical protein
MVILYLLMRRLPHISLLLSRMSWLWPIRRVSICRLLGIHIGPLSSGFFHYINLTITHGVHLQITSSGILFVFSDADWVGSPDDRWSTGGYAILHEPMWIAKSEYKTLVNANVELLWVQSLLQELGICSVRPHVLWCDNIGVGYIRKFPHNLIHESNK